uniref:Conserved hypothetical plastid protein n=1 Tax=Rhodochaete parvula TaxID=110510 RepID=A0A1X9PV85_9RHOD|nr:conserved hypothetical plastid protein [Rhodochaete parvula]ASK39705.1 GCN5-like N-acetyltransferase [Rhodochaete parvula]
MTLWTLFFQNSNILSNKNDNEIGNTILINSVKYQDELINIYVSKNKNINLNDLEKLCDSVGWMRRPIKKVKIAIKNSFLVLSLFQKLEDENRLIGFARATSDYTFNATIWDVVIHPEFQGQGLGSALVCQIIKELRYEEINTITLFADPEVVTFYKSLGFISDPNGIKGMFWYPK